MSSAPSLENNKYKPLCLILVEERLNNGNYIIYECDFKKVSAIHILCALNHLKWTKTDTPCKITNRSKENPRLALNAWSSSFMLVLRY